MTWEIFQLRDWLLNRVGGDKGGKLQETRPSSEWRLKSVRTARKETAGSRSSFEEIAGEEDVSKERCEKKCLSVSFLGDGGSGRLANANGWRSGALLAG